MTTATEDTELQEKLEATKGKLANQMKAIEYSKRTPRTGCPDGLVPVQLEL